MIRAEASVTEESAVRHSGAGKTQVRVCEGTPGNVRSYTVTCKFE